MILVGVGLLVVGGLTVWRLRLNGHGRFRAGPWPGLLPAGAGVLLGCALLLAGGQLLLSDPRQPLPDLPVLAVLAVCPIVLVTRLVGAPGLAAAVCGAYLLPRTLLSLLDASLEPPPLLLVPAVAFDVTAWLRGSDLTNLRYVLGAPRAQWRRRTGGPGRVVRRRRMVLAGAVFGAVFVIVEPPFRVLLGADPAVWDGSSLWLAGGLSALGCALAGLALSVSGRGTAA